MEETHQDPPESPPSLSIYQDETSSNTNSPAETPRSFEFKNPSERVILNVGGTKFETHVNTLTTIPGSLLGAMFSDRNAHLRRPDSMGEPLISLISVGTSSISLQPHCKYFFDRSPLVFESILNFYRTGKMIKLPGIRKEMIEEEMEFWQLPPNIIISAQEEKLGNKLAHAAIEVVRKKILEKIKNYIIQRIESAASEGVQSFSIEFKESQQQEYYAFLSNFSHRELLLHDLLQENFDVSFNDITNVLLITLWNRYTRQRLQDPVNGMAKILEELRHGVEIKTSKDDHILTVKLTYM